MKQATRESTELDIDTGQDLQGIRIDKQGNWFYNGLPIVNRSIYLFFNQHLEQNEAEGFYLRIGEETCPVVVEDTPFVVTTVSLASQQEPQKSYFSVRLNDETEEHLELTSLWVGKDNILYCVVKNGRFKARFLRNSYYHLAQHICEEDGGRFYIPLNGKNYYINISLDPLTP